MIRLHPRPLLQLSDHLTRTRCQLEYQQQQQQQEIETDFQNQNLFICGLLFGSVNAASEAVECTFATELLPVTSSAGNALSDADLAESVDKLLSVESIRTRVEMIRTVLPQAEEVQCVYLYSCDAVPEYDGPIVTRLLEKLREALETDGGGGSVEYLVLVSEDDSAFKLKAVNLRTGQPIAVDTQSCSTQHETITCQSLLLSSSSASAGGDSAKSASSQFVQDYIGAIDVLSSKVRLIIDYLQQLPQDPQKLQEHDYVLMQQICALNGRLNKQSPQPPSDQEDANDLLLTSQFAETVRILSSVSSYNQSQKESASDPFRQRRSRMKDTESQLFSMGSRFDAAFDNADDDNQVNNIDIQQRQLSQARGMINSMQMGSSPLIGGRLGGDADGYFSNDDISSGSSSNDPIITD